MRIHPVYPYSNRNEKAAYVWEKYQKFLKGRVLDVGADRGYLEKYLPAGVEYVTAGLEPDHDLQVNLENGLNVEPGSFDCVQCLDVLEHIENIHCLFDDLCRASSKYLIISLPNPWGSFVKMLRHGYYDENRPLKFYNLPVDPPTDRHRWFFSPTEALRFIEERGKRNLMQVIQVDQFGLDGLKPRINRFLLSVLIHPSINPKDLVSDTLWVVLEKAA